jgi:hypothetical protein
MQMDSSSVQGSANLPQADEKPANDIGEVAQPIQVGGPFSRRQSAMVHLRLFGRNIQDSSIVVGYGNYDGTQLGQEMDPRSFRDTADRLNSAIEDKGSEGSAELQIYLTHWLGMQGSYKKMEGKVQGTDTRTNHTNYDYGTFLEVSLLRLGASIYTEERVYRDAAGVSSEVEEGGVKASVKLQF